MNNAIYTDTSHKCVVDLSIKVMLVLRYVSSYFLGIGKSLVAYNASVHDDNSVRLIHLLGHLVAFVSMQKHGDLSMERPAILIFIVFLEPSVIVRRWLRNYMTCNAFRLYAGFQVLSQSGFASTNKSLDCNKHNFSF